MPGPSKDARVAHTMSAIFSPSSSVFDRSPSSPCSAKPSRPWRARQRRSWSGDTEQIGEGRPQELLAQPVVGRRRGGRPGPSHRRKVGRFECHPVDDHGGVVEHPQPTNGGELAARGVGISGRAVTVAHTLGQVNDPRRDIPALHLREQCRRRASERRALDAWNLRGDVVGAEVLSIDVAYQHAVGGRCLGHLGLAPQLLRRPAPPVPRH